MSVSLLAVLMDNACPDGLIQTTPASFDVILYSFFNNAASLRNICVIYTGR